MANIYLHFILDLWFEKIEKRQSKGLVQLVRYADDFIVCFQYGKEAKVFIERLKQRLDKFGLKIAEDKSRLIEFGRFVWQKAQRQNRKLATFDFLGFTHFCEKTRKGKFKLGRKTVRTRFQQKIAEMNKWLKRVRNRVKLEKWWKVLRTKLFGHYRYYGISGNMRALEEFNFRTIRLAYKWINKRRQKKSYNWEQFNRVMEYNPLPKPKIYHLANYALSS